MSTATQRRFDGIEGLEGKEPVGAVVTIGEKGEKGNPTHTDRFFVKSVHEEKRGEIRIRPAHPAFAAYNSADPAKRQSLSGNIVHETRHQAFQYQLRALVLPGKKAHPNMRPACEGDGTSARRFYGIGEDGSEDFRDIPCPNELCEFRQGNEKVCKPFGRIYFRPRWAAGSPLPAPLMKLTTQSWYSIRAFIGFFDYVEGIAKQLGIENPVLFGIPFTLTLQRKSLPLKQRAFPVLTISPDFDPIEFFMRQREQIKLAGGTMRALPAASAIDPEENEPEAIAADVRAITPSIPGVVHSPAQENPVEDAVLVDAESRVPLEPPHVLKILAAGRALGLTEEQISAHIGASVRTCIPEFENEALRKLKALRPQR